MKVVGTKIIRRRSNKSWINGKFETFFSFFFFPFENSIFRSFSLSIRSKQYYEDRTIRWYALAHARVFLVLSISLYHCRDRQWKLSLGELPYSTRVAPCSNIARISRPETLIDLSQNYSAATRRKSLKKILNLETGFMRVKCAAARKGAWQKERAGYSTCHHHSRARTRPRRSSFDPQRFLPYAVFIIKEKKLGRKTRSVSTTSERDSKNSFKDIIRRVIYLSMKPRGRRGGIETWNEFFPWNLDFFSPRRKITSYSFSYARQRVKISSKCNNWAGELKKVEKNRNGRSARFAAHVTHEGHANRVREVECTEIERRWERAARTMTQKIQTGRGEADSRNASFLRFLPYALNIFGRKKPEERHVITRYYVIPQPWKAWIKRGDRLSFHYSSRDFTFKSAY